jgi:hypothetical protein
MFKVVIIAIRTNIERFLIDLVKLDELLIDDDVDEETQLDTLRYHIE